MTIKYLVDLACLYSLQLMSGSETADSHPVLVQCWPSVSDGGPTITQLSLMARCDDIGRVPVRTSAARGAIVTVINERIPLNTAVHNKHDK